MMKKTALIVIATLLKLKFTLKLINAHRIFLFLPESRNKCYSSYV